MKILSSTKIFAAALLSLSVFLLSAQVHPPRHMENLGRGVVATQTGNGNVFVSWRLLGTDPGDISFNVYRTSAGNTVKLNSMPVTRTTGIMDTKPDLSTDNTYYVRPILRSGKEDTPSKSFTIKAGNKANYISIPLRTPEGYTPNDCSTGDLDGDGEYEIIVHMAGRGRDNAFSGFSDDPIFQAYKLDGTFLWEINLGKNIRDGAHYTQFMVYDFDGDGRAEMVCKTADGTKDGVGNIIGDTNADWREKGGFRPTRDRTGSTRDSLGNMVAAMEGRIISGPEYLTVFEGLTGKALATVDYLPGRGDLASWGDTYANRSERYLACVAYLDGVHPSVVMCRGYYSRASLAAWDWDGKELKSRWIFDTDSDPEGLKAYKGQGNHNLAVADVDNDGFDEIIYGAACIDHNGKPLYTTGLKHGDAMHIGDLDITRPGLEVFAVHETPHPTAGMEMHDARTGEILWGVGSPNDNGRGVSFDIDARHEGNESWSSSVPGIYSANGLMITPKKPSSTNFGIWWDGDLNRELLNGNTISKWDWELETTKNIFTAQGCSSNNGSKSTPALSADILGDWREELILRTSDNKELRIFSTPIPTNFRIYTLMHDPVYRLAIAWQNVAYNQPPNTGFFIGTNMQPAPKPNIVTSWDKPAPVQAAPAIPAETSARRRR